MRTITSKDIEALNISPIQCMNWVREVFAIKRECQLPPKISLHPQGNDFFNTMPCLLPPDYNTFGCKIVSRIQGNNPTLKSDIFLYDSRMGQMKAILDGNWITAMRTGAVAATAINTLRNSKAKIYSFIGLGVIGHSTLDCFLESNNNSQITIRLKKYKDHAEKVIHHYSGKYPKVKFETSEEVEELVANADVIVSCVTEANDLIVEDVDLFKEGVLVVPVHTRGFQNCDILFDKVFADDEGHVRGFRYFNEFRKFGELGDVLSNITIGRESDKERILSYNIGLGIFDIFFAHKIYQQAI